MAITLPDPQDTGAVTVHASTVAMDGKAVAIFGPSGSGKSALALELMARGAALVADDRTVLTRDSHGLTARAPDTLRGRIEARHVGILNAAAVPDARLVLCVDLAETEAQRLPPLRHITILGHDVPLLFGVRAGHFPAAILQYIKAGRSA